MRDQGDLPVIDYAAEQLTRRWRKVRKKGRAISRLDARSRHKLRIQTKKLRYAVEFFATLFQNKRAAKRRKHFHSALERLQNGLGDLNDIAVHEKTIAALSVHHPRSDPSRVFAAGLLTGREDARWDAAMSTAILGYSKVVNARSFW